MSNTKKGKYGEDVAAVYLLKRGYKIIKRNWACRWGEIDLICEKDSILVFVEVKARSSSAFGEGYEAVTHGKKKRLYRAVYRYLYENNKNNVVWVCDVISINLQNKKLKIRHLSNIFE